MKKTNKTQVKKTDKNQVKKAEKTQEEKEKLAYSKKLEEIKKEAAIQSKKYNLDLR